MAWRYWIHILVYILQWAVYFRRAEGWRQNKCWGNDGWCSRLHWGREEVATIYFVHRGRPEVGWRPLRVSGRQYWREIFQIWPHISRVSANIWGPSHHEGMVLGSKICQSQLSWYVWNNKKLFCQTPKSKSQVESNSLAVRFLLHGVLKLRTQDATTTYQLGFGNCSPNQSILESMIVHTG